MIKSITVTNYVGEKLKMELRNPKPHGLHITNVTGIQPGVANLRANEFSSAHGGVFNSGRMPMRQIVIDIKFLASPTYEDSLHRTYKYFPVMKPLQLEFETDTRHCTIDGYVESNDGELFSRESGTQISIMCPNPFFRSIEDDLTQFYGEEPAFEFEWSNESIDEPLLLMGEIQQEPERLIKYTGDSEVGFIITMRAYGTVVNPSLYDLNDRKFMKIDTARIKKITGKGIEAGDELIINTIQGQKSVTLRREGRDTNVLSSLTRDSSWLQLSKGDNHYAYLADQGFGVMNVTILSYVLYEGI